MNASLLLSEVTPKKLVYFLKYPKYHFCSEDEPSVLFPSMRLMLAAMLCCCFITLSISSSNLAVALICMTSCPLHGYGGDLTWRSEQVPGS